jgi:hypothetical protein
MESVQFDDREVNLSAALYLNVGGDSLLNHIQKTENFSKSFKGIPFWVIPIRLLLEERGSEITIMPDE